jgi:ribosomal protein L40E
MDGAALPQKFKFLLIMALDASQGAVQGVRANANAALKAGQPRKKSPRHLGSPSMSVVLGAHIFPPMRWKTCSDPYGELDGRDIVNREEKTIMTGQRAAQRFCHKCGAEIPAGSSYCRVCGYSPGGKPDEPSRRI